MSVRKSKIGAIAGSAGIALMLAVAIPAPAQAAVACGLNAGTGNVSGAPAYSYTTAQNVSCASVQARVYRYQSSTIVTYTGAMSSQSSYVSSTGGTAAGGAVRGQAGTVWSPWTGV